MEADIIQERVTKHLREDKTLTGDRREPVGNIARHGSSDSARLADTCVSGGWQFNYPMFEVPEMGMHDPISALRTRCLVRPRGEGIIGYESKDWEWEAKRRQ